MKLKTSLTILLLTAASAMAQTVPDHSIEVDKIFAWTKATEPGCAVAASQDGKLVINKTYGSADLERNVPITSNTVFDAGSIRKQFVAASILLLAEEGKLALTDDVRKYIPELPDYGHKITIDHLLTHTSGIRDWQPLLNLAGGDPTAMTMILRQRELNFMPGDEWSYSNSGYVLLGEVIEIISGQSYETFLIENVFKPAGMNSTEMEYIQKPSARWVKGYAHDTSNDIPFVDPEAYHMPFSAGGLRSNALDLLKFIDALNSGKIIGKESLKKMTSYALLNNSKPVYEGVYRAPGAQPNKPHKEFAKSGYGLGFNIMELYETPVYYHSGGIAGFNSYLIHIPKNNTTMVLLANTEDGIIPELKGILKLATEIDSQ